MHDGSERALTVGAPVRRREDPRLLTGRGRYVADVELPRLLHVGFVRSVHCRSRGGWVRSFGSPGESGSRGFRVNPTGHA